MSERFEKLYQQLGQNLFLGLHDRAREVLDSTLDEMGYAPGSANHHMQEEVPDLCRDPRFDQATWKALYVDPTVDESDYYDLEIRGEIDPNGSDVQSAMESYIQYGRARIDNQVLYLNAGSIQDLAAMDMLAPYIDVCSCIGLGVLRNAKSNPVLEKYIEHGADINAKSSYGETILNRCDETPIETVELYIKLGADVHARDYLGHTALFNNHREEVFAVLLRHGADQDAKTNDGNDVREYLKGTGGLDAFDRAFAIFERERLSQTMAKPAPREFLAPPSLAKGDESMAPIVKRKMRL